MTLSRAPLRLGRTDVGARLARFAGCAAAAGGEAGQTARVVADYLRHGLCHLGAEEGANARAVHVHQLLSALRQQLSGWLPEPDLPPWVLPEEAGPASKDEEPDAAAHLGG